MNLKNKLFINEILLETFFKRKCKRKNFLHIIKIIIRSSLLYYLFLCLRARNFLFFVEKPSRRGNFMSHGLLRISASHLIETHILIVVVGRMFYLLDHSGVW